MKKWGEGGFYLLNYRYDLKVKARQLRKDMTDSEQALWRRLRAKQLRGVSFYRQKPIGPYIVDFYGPVAKLVIEVDGSSHLEPAGLDRDEKREAYLRQEGLRVLRFDDRQVLLEMNGVIELVDSALAAALGEIPPDPPFPKGGKNR